MQILAMGMQPAKHGQFTNKNIAMDPAMMGIEDSNRSTAG
jgi:hypothetical protein